MNHVLLVNPFIGTTNGGNVFPRATVPFGMVQFSPEASPWRENRAIAAPGGYEYRAAKIRGFSLTNVEGWGCVGASGDVPLMPIPTAVTQSPSDDFRTGYAAGFSHKDEQASPGYYRVTFDTGVTAELSATLRSGAALFHFPRGSTRTVLIRTSDSEVGSTAATTTVDMAARTVTGSVTSGNFCGYIDKEDRKSYYTLYFVIRFDQPFADAGTWRNAQSQRGSTNTSGGTGFGAKGFPEKGAGSGAWVTFGGDINSPVMVRVGISYMSEQNACQSES